jgi:taurine dioxygenase
MDGSIPGLQVKRLSGSIGAEIRGIRLRPDMPAETIAELRRIWLANSVLFFRDQDLTAPELAAFARRFGEVIHYPFLKGLEEAPEVIPVVKLAHETQNFGGLWHADTTYLPQPPMATMLIARELPPQGGDTLFASGYAAYDGLSDGMKRLLAPLRAVFSSVKAEFSRTREDQAPGAGRGKSEAEHPVIRTHPETDLKSLYVNFGHTLRFKDMTVEESAGLLDWLFAHQVKPEYTCRFQWEPGSIAFWDNRCALHNPVNDYHGYKRLLHRVTLAGDTPS